MNEHGIPMIVFYQALNFFGLLIILYFLLRKKVQAFFFARHEHLTVALREAKKLKEEAEVKNQEYLKKIKTLEEGQSNLINQIRIEGENSKQRIIAEAKKLAEAIQVEAARSAQNETEKAKAALYDEVLEQALTGARQLLGKSVAEKDQLRLQKEFLEKIEAVQ